MTDQVKPLSADELIAEVPRIIGSGTGYWTPFTLEHIERLLPQYAAAIDNLRNANDTGKDLLEAQRDVARKLLARAETAEAEVKRLRAYVQKVRNISVGKHDALRVCVGLMKEANALLSLPDAPQGAGETTQ